MLHIVASMECHLSGGRCGAAGHRAGNGIARRNGGPWARRPWTDCRRKRSTNRASAHLRTGRCQWPQHVVPFGSAAKPDRRAQHPCGRASHATHEFSERAIYRFTEPEVAWVGLSEDAARKHSNQVSVARYDYRTDSRAQIFGETNGFIQLIFGTGTSRLLGAQVAGMDAAHLIAPLALAVQQGSTAETLTGVPFPHPMIAEGINRAARDFCP